MKQVMKTVTFAAVSAFALAACGGEAIDADADGDGEVTQAEVANAAQQLGDDVKPQPGKYSSTVEFVSAEIPGAPDEMIDIMRAAAGNSFEFCMTEEMAQEGFGEAMKSDQDDSCTISKMTIDAGEMDMVMACNPEGTGEVTVAMKGSVSPTSADITMVTEGSFGPMGEGKMEMNIKQTRIGDCDAE